MIGSGCKCEYILKAPYTSKFFLIIFQYSTFATWDDYDYFLKVMIHGKERNNNYRKECCGT